MSNKNRETIADILAEMRDFANGQEKNHCYDLREMATDNLRVLADRIEMAVDHTLAVEKVKAAREGFAAGEQSATDCNKRENVAAMRGALVENQCVITKCMDILNRIPDGVPYDGLIDDVADELCDLRNHVKKALSAPPRNCDVGTANEQIERHKKWCNSDRCIYKNCGECHIEPDWLLVYQYVDNELVLLLVTTGSHSEIF